MMAIHPHKMKAYAATHPSRMDQLRTWRRILSLRCRGRDMWRTFASTPRFSMRPRVIMFAQSHAGVPG
jgi:hypothetical protein